MVGSFYRQLAAGRRLGAALRAARREAWADGRPAAAWAALALMGEPDAAPLAGVPLTRPWPRPELLAWMLGLAVLAALVAVLGSRRRRPGRE